MQHVQELLALYVPVAGWRATVKQRRREGRCVGRVRAQERERERERDACGSGASLAAHLFGFICCTERRFTMTAEALLPQPCKGIGWQSAPVKPGRQSVQPSPTRPCGHGAACTCFPSSATAISASAVGERRSSWLVGAAASAPVKCSPGIHPRRHKSRSRPPGESVQSRHTQPCVFSSNPSTPRLHAGSQDARGVWRGYGSPRSPHSWCAVPAVGGRAGRPLRPLSEECPRIWPGNLRHTKICTQGGAQL